MTNKPHTSQALALLRLRKAPRVILSDYAAALLRHSETVEREDLVRLLSLDPLMAVWILKRANSSYYGLRSTVDNVDRAISVLEETSIAGMFANTFGAKAAEHDELPSASPDPLTRHSVASALLAAQIHTGDTSSRGLAFTAGLLHDIGKHVFLLNFPDEAGKMYNSSMLWQSLHGTDLCSIEQLAFGLDHREVGEFVARKMHFPEILVDILRAHAAPSMLLNAGEATQVAHIVHAASIAASALGYEAGQTVSWDECQSHSCWNQLLKFGHVEWASSESLLSVLQKSVSVIDEFLDFEVNRSKTLMKLNSQPKKKNREPVQKSSQHDVRSNSRRQRLEE